MLWLLLLAKVFVLLQSLQQLLRDSIPKSMDGVKVVFTANTVCLPRFVVLQME